MYRGSGPRILPLIIVIVIVALVIAALVTIGRMVFTGGSQSGDQENKDAATTAILDTTAARSVQWTVRGPLVADENFRTYQIIVSPKERVYTVYSGYLGSPLESKRYANNTAAYEQFVFALNKAEAGKTREAENVDIRGVCATDGLAYTLETLVNDTADNKLWSSTCKNSPGTLAANPLQIHALFTNQIPDFKPIFNSVY
ncbi:MAG: hypothetical protein WBP12_00570 [Candidatus Saccharimonas sp.]